MSATYKFTGISSPTIPYFSCIKQLKNERWKQSGHEALSTNGQKNVAAQDDPNWLNMDVAVENVTECSTTLKTHSNCSEKEVWFLSYD